MNKDKTIERLRAKLAEKDQEVKALKRRLKNLRWVLKITYSCLL